MKHLLIILTLFPLCLTAQNISVASFRSLPNDLTARITAPVIDQNGEKCALIKIKTTQTGFVFDGDMMGIEKTEQKTAEIWVYVPHGAKKLSIAQQQLGRLDNYLYPEPIKEATVYEMVLTTGTVVTTVVNKEIPTQWVVITSQPTGASIFINDENKGLTPFQQELPEGKYTYRVEYPMYYTDAGAFNLVAAKGKKTMEINLSPNFGNIHVTSQPETGATVFLDEQPTNKKTPCTLKNIKSGQHTVRLQREWYQPITNKITVADTQTTELPVVMLPNFSNVKVTTQNKTKIYIDGTYKANSNWQGRLIAGYHTFEAKKEKYYTAKTKIKINAGENKELSLHPKPMLGKVKIITNPFNATITIDGKEYGKTPLTIDSLSIGNHKLVLNKIGLRTYKKIFEIKNNKTTQIKTDLKHGMEISFNTQPNGANIIIDGNKMGVTPCKINLDAGKYKVKYVKNHFNIIDKEITITPDNRNFSVKLIPKSVNIKITSNPTKAKIFINNRYFGETNKSFNLLAYEYNLKISKRGFKPFEQKEDFAKKQEYNFDLIPKRHHSKALAIFYSMIMPGLGQTYLHRQGSAWLISAVCYGMIGVAVMQNNEAVDDYQKYKIEENLSDKDIYIKKAKTEYNQAQMLMYAAAGTWFMNMVWVSFMQTDNKRFKNIKPTVGYNNQTKTLNYGITMKIN